MRLSYFLSAILLCVTFACLPSHATQLRIDPLGVDNLLIDYDYDYSDLGKIGQVNSQLYFSAPSTSGRAVFRMDEEKIESLPVVLEQHADSYYFLASPLNNQFYFRAAEHQDGRAELYRTDGSSIQHIPLADTPFGPSPRNFQAVGNFLYFDATYSPTEESWEQALYATDGVTIQQLADNSSETSYPWNVPVSNLLYFPANGPDGFELHRADGFNITQVIDVNPGPANSDPWPGLEFNGHFYFTAIGPTGRELYKTDGTTTTKLPIYPDGEQYGGPVNFLVHDNQLFFSAKHANGFEVFSTDGETVQEFDLNPGPESSGALSSHNAIFGEQLLVGVKGLSGRELFIIEKGAFRSFDINPGPANSDPSYFTEFHGEIYFQAEVGDQVGLFKTDGHQVDQLFTLPDTDFAGFALYNAVEFNDQLFMLAVNEGMLSLLGVDGTSISQFDIPKSDGWYGIDYLYPLGDYLVFTLLTANEQTLIAFDGSSFQELMKVSSVEIESSYDFIPGMTRLMQFEDSLYFVAQTRGGFDLHRATVVPEPAAVCLLLAGALTLAFCRRRVSLRRLPSDVCG
jgi:hypothetical protein